MAIENATLSNTGTVPAGLEIYSREAFMEPELRPFLHGMAAVFSARAPNKETANEDSAALIPVDERRGVIVIADGVGGHSDGAKASRLAIDALVSALLQVDEPDSELRSAILHGIDDANRAVRALATGAATTLAAVDVHGSTIRPYHVGDSLILVTGQRGKLKLQTISHSPVGYALESGLLDESQAMQSDERHLVSNVVGSADMRIEIGPRLKLARFDTLLLASDGLSDNLAAEEIVEGVRQGPLEQRAAQLMARCTARMREGGHPDDLTAILYRRSASPRARPASGPRSLSGDTDV
jgi:serine/threonine protein phosphatase PrpC